MIVRLSRAQSIPNDSQADNPTFTILSNGSEIDPAYQVFSITVDKTVNRIPTAQIVVRDGEVSEGQWEVTDADAFEPGAELEIKAGYGSNDETIFKGVVIKQKVKVFNSGQSVLRVECKDACFPMALGRKQRYFVDVKDSDAIEEILNAHGVKGTVDVTTVTHKELVQYYASDWDYVLSRAEANGLMVIAEDGEVNVQTPKTSGSTKLDLAFGGNLINFEAEVDARYQWKSVKANAWDFASQALFESESNSVDFQENGNLSGENLADVAGLDSYDLAHGGFMDTDELKSWADACLIKSRLAKICGRAGFKGFVQLRPGDLVELQGVGERFNGVVYLTGVRYELVDGVCKVDIQFGLSPKWFYQQYDVTDHAASGLFPGVNGLQIGIVKQLEGDPDNNDRILVYLPIIASSDDGTWARLASLDAGNQRGWVIRPEIGDEVIVGFINDDPRDCVVLGQLHSAAHPAPIPAADDNHIKGYTTRSEMKVEFDDDQKIITIETPAGNTMIFSEADSAITIEDQNGNSCVMDSAGITIKSSKDITMEAPGKITIKATQDLSMEGLNVNGKASVGMKMEGSATAELSSGGQTTVKGSMLMLN